MVFISVEESQEQDKKIKKGKNTCYFSFVAFKKRVTPNKNLEIFIKLDEECYI